MPEDNYFHNIDDLKKEIEKYKEKEDTLSIEERITNTIIRMLNIPNFFGDNRRLANELISDYLQTKQR